MEVKACILRVLVSSSTSEWSTSLKGMEELVLSVYRVAQLRFVRMEHFPERDGSVCGLFRAIAVFAVCPNGALP